MRTTIMGILNVTPDSFSDGGHYLDPDKAIARGMQMIEHGATIIDVGGESTRPGATPISTEEEIDRVLPVVSELARHGRVSIDTRHSEVARVAIGNGATIVNDVSASLAEVAAEAGVGWVAMHMQGEPGTMQTEPHYDDVVEEVAEFLFARAEHAKSLGIADVWIDPGIGFGKTLGHNLSLLKHLDRLTSSSWPVVLGASRKTFIGTVNGGERGPTPVDDRVEGSISVANWAVSQNVAVLRVHDVTETVRAVEITEAVRDTPT